MVFESIFNFLHIISQKYVNFAAKKTSKNET